MAYNICLISGRLTVNNSTFESVMIVCPKFEQTHFKHLFIVRL